MTAKPGFLTKLAAVFRKQPQSSTGLKRWKCIACGYVYDEAEGWPEDNIAPGTRWEDIPQDWICPDCGTGKQDFKMIEIR